MFYVLIVALLRGSTAEIAAESWSCANDVEIACAEDGCRAAPAGEFTPMSVTAEAEGGFSVCAYTGCWESDAPPVAANGRLLWTGDDLPFSTSPDGGMRTDATLLIVEKDGVGFVRAAGFATPLLCTRRGPDLEAPVAPEGGAS